MTERNSGSVPLTIRERVHEVVFEADTFSGRAFDLLLLWSILLSTAVVLIESVGFYQERYGQILYYAEWTFTIGFTIEYLVRLWCVRSAIGYARSFYGIVDLLAILPTYLSLILPGAQPLMVVRALRLLRIFRILKMGHFVTQGESLIRALKASAVKITVFLFAVITFVLILGATMYLIEGQDNPGFDSIPKSMYWAVVTLTTVGYGDITPKSTLGQFFASLVMVTGYAIIAIPTGIVSVEIAKAVSAELTTQHCPTCSREGHDRDATHCKYCGAEL